MTIVQSGDGGRMCRQCVTLTGGGDRDRDGDDKEDNDRTKWWRREDKTWTRDVKRRRGQGQEQQ
jgi:hypothetical protein